MFYLLSAEGTHTHKGVTVTGIGIQKAMKIALKANNPQYWLFDATYPNAKNGMIRAAQDLGMTAFEVEQVRKAWTAVGVN